MKLKRTILHMAVAAGLAVGTQGLLPAPMCGWCRTPSDFSTYMYQVQHPSTGFMQTVWSILTSILTR
jgi:hypothetical protein